MTADTFTFRGKLRIQPAPTNTDNSGNTTVDADLLEQMAIVNKLDTNVSLDADPAESVSFGDLLNVNVVMLRSDTKVKAAFTSADGAAQVLPVDKFLLVTSESVPFTALTLQRVTGVTANVRVVLGERAT
jgi:hypothetical protein